MQQQSFAIPWFSAILHSLLPLPKSLIPQKDLAMFVRPIKALFHSIALLTLLATTASQQVQAVGLTSQPTTTGDKVHLAAAALSGPVSMAAIAYPNSRLLGCAEHVLKTIDEFMAMAQYREFHPSLIGWFCYDVYHAFTALQSPTVQPMIDTDIDDQLAAIEANDANEKPITLSNGQRSTIKQFIRYVLAGVEASTRVVAACKNGQAESPTHATYLWNSRGFVHSITSLARLTNYYLETEKDDHKAVLFALMIINAVGSVAYFTGSQNAYTAYSAELQTQQARRLAQLPTTIAQTNTASTTASAAPRRATQSASAPTATPSATASTTPRRNATVSTTATTTAREVTRPATTGTTASTAATNMAPTRRTAHTDRPAHNTNPTLEAVATAQDVVTPIIAMPSTAAAVSANRSRLAPAPRPTPPARSLPAIPSPSNFEDDALSLLTSLPTTNGSDEKPAIIGQTADQPTAHMLAPSTTPLVDQKTSIASASSTATAPTLSSATDTGKTAIVIAPDFIINYRVRKGMASGQTLDRDNIRQAPVDEKEARQAKLLVQMRARRPVDGKNPAFNHDDFRMILLEFFPGFYNRNRTTREQYGRTMHLDSDSFSNLVSSSCLVAGVSPFFNDRKYRRLLAAYWNQAPLTSASPDEIDRFCRGFQAFCTNQTTAHDLQATVQVFCQERGVAIGYCSSPQLFRYYFDQFCNDMGIEAFFTNEALAKLFDTYMEGVGFSPEKLPTLCRSFQGFYEQIAPFFTSLQQDAAKAKLFDTYMECVGFSPEKLPTLCRSFQGFYEQIASMHERLKTPHDSKEPVLNFDDFESVLRIFYANQFNLYYQRPGRDPSMESMTPAQKFFIRFSTFCKNINIWHDGLKRLFPGLPGFSIADCWKQYSLPDNATPQDIEQFCKRLKQIVETNATPQGREQLHRRLQQMCEPDTKSAQSKT
jgi:hypothetical protein